jgi:uncharacterized membrane protein YeaQ/YmgE (transglycosylase-associated protein family)
MLILLTYLLVATVIGWVATELMHDRPNLLLNIGLAVVGAFLAIYFLGPFLRAGTVADIITAPARLIMLLGSVSLLAVVSLLRRRANWSAR